MSLDVTITGGSAHPAPFDLGYNTSDAAYTAAKALAAALSTADAAKKDTVFSSGPKVTGTAGGLAIVADGTTAAANLKGFSGIGVQDTSGPAIIQGGGVTNQSVVAGVGGLTFYANQSTVVSATNISLAALGGNNYISLANNRGTDVVTTSTGNDTIVAGNGAASISAGTGDNSIVGGSGTMNVLIDGQDTVMLGTGFATITVDAAAPAASVLIMGTPFLDAAPPAGQYSLLFQNGTVAGTVIGGAGSYSINGGTGGGTFEGGSDGNNHISSAGEVTIEGGGANDTLIAGAGGGQIVASTGGNSSLVGGTGAVELDGGGIGDTLVGGSSTSNLLVQGAGSETLIAGTGNTTLVGLSGSSVGTFSFASIGGGNAGSPITDLVTGFESSDKLAFANSADSAYAVAHYHVSGGSGTITLGDSTTKIVLLGYRGGIAGDTTP